MKEAYDTVLVKTAYQGYISDFVRSMLEELGEVDFTRWRMHGDMRSKAKIEELMQGTDFWKNKKNANATSYLKKEIIERSCKRDTDVNNFFQENMSVYFPDDSKFTPLAKIDNSLRQYYDVKASSTCNLMGIEDFSQFFRCIENENMPLINEASLIKSKSAIRSCVSHATITGITGIKNDLEHLQNKGQGKEI